MFGKVSEDSFHTSIFDLSLDGDSVLTGPNGGNDSRNSSMSKQLSVGVNHSTQLGLGLGSCGRPADHGRPDTGLIRQSETLSANLVASLIALQKQQQQQQQQINSQGSPSSPGIWGSGSSWGSRGGHGAPPESPTSSISSFDSLLLTSRNRQPFDNLDQSSETSSSAGSTGSKGSSGLQVPVNSSRYKTEMCRPYQENGTCKYGDKCQFAHGYAELRTISRHPKYKTDLCRTYHSSGFCPYGPRCHFIHNLEEQQPATAAAANGTATNGLTGRQNKSAEKENCQSAQGIPAQLPIFQSPRSNAGQSQQPINSQEAVIRSAAAQMLMQGELSGKQQAQLFQQLRNAQAAASSESSALHQHQPQLFNSNASREPASSSRLPVFSTLYN